MYPIIFEYNGLVISSYGLMLMLAFLCCNYLLKQYLISINVDGKIGDDIIFYAAIGGIVGAKLYYILENLHNGEGLHNIQGISLIFQGIFTFSFTMIANGITQFGSGLVFLGGLIGGMLSVTIYIKKNNLKWTIVSDWVAPYLILGHSIGRIGCFLVGDCYGKPCDLPWAFSFPNGLPPTSFTSFKYNYPEIFSSYIEPYYNINDVIKVHPTQLYESLIYFIIFLYLLYIRKKKEFNGQIMYEYLFLAGLSRFIIEFYRINPKYIMNLSGAQCLSIVMIVMSSFLMYNNYLKLKKINK